MLCQLTRLIVSKADLMNKVKPIIILFIIFMQKCKLPAAKSKCQLTVSLTTRSNCRKQVVQVTQGHSRSFEFTPLSRARVSSY